MKIERIVFATGNEGKLKEIREILADFEIEVISMKEAGIQEEIPEDGKTFSENSLIKSRFVCRKTGLPALADDSGLEIDFLGGEPGVYSARYLGRDTDYFTKNSIILDKLKEAPFGERGARFVCAISLVLPDKREYVTEGIMEGEIAHEIKGEHGFGYDPIFYLPEYRKTSAEISPEEKNKISHRGKALRGMVDRIRFLMEE